jgi:hypothetical protein
MIMSLPAPSDPAAEKKKPATKSSQVFRLITDKTIELGVHPGAKTGGPHG